MSQKGLLVITFGIGIVILHRPSSCDYATLCHYDLMTWLHKAALEDNSEWFSADTEWGRLLVHWSEWIYALFIQKEDSPAYYTQFYTGSFYYHTYL